MTPTDVAAAVRAAVAGSVRDGELGVDVPEQVEVSRPRNREHGDYATNVALQLARPAGQPPRQVAETLAARLRASEGIAGVEVAGPGFLNITLAGSALGAVARRVVTAGRGYGRSAPTSTAESVNLEFVSANPTGPVHLGGARWAAVGDSLARLLEATGSRVTREYYFNDHGVQIDRFARSLLARARGQEAPPDGYGGQYISDIADAVLAAHPGVLDQPDAQETFRAAGVERMFAEIQATLHDFGVDFDVYFHEDTLHQSGAVDRAIARLHSLGHMFTADGARWLRTTDFGDDKDRVVVKSDGDAAYIAGDLAYYLDKRERGFDRVVIMLGADHHGYVGRMMAMCAAFGDTPGVNLEILIGQLVNLVRHGEPVRMSKRAGTVVALDDLIDAIGVDAARYALVRSSVEASVDIDLDLWSRRANDNPVFYVQMAHARIHGIVRNAAEWGVALDAEADVALLTASQEVDLLGALGEYPRVVAAAAELRAPHRVARYLEDLAGTFHRFYDACRVLPQGDELPTPATSARLLLCEATRVVLSNGLDLLGVRAPERM